MDCARGITLLYRIAQREERKVGTAGIDSALSFSSTIPIAWVSMASTPDPSGELWGACEDCEDAPEHELSAEHLEPPLLLTGGSGSIALFGICPHVFDRSAPWGGNVTTCLSGGSCTVRTVG